MDLGRSDSVQEEEDGTEAGDRSDRSPLRE